MSVTWIDARPDVERADTVATGRVPTSEWNK